MPIIPKIIHQTWKSNEIPRKWIPFVEKVKSLNPDWEYKLWTDSNNDEFVQNNFPEFFNIFNQFSKNIMKADVIRYLIMSKIGGVYLDLDYEVLRPFDFKEHNIVLPINKSKKYGDKIDGLGNCIMASIPGHKFWNDVIRYLSENPPQAKNFTDVVESTGPRLLSKIYFQGIYQDIWTPDKMLYHPPSPKSKIQYKKILKEGKSLGIHHGWGSWKERFSWIYLRKKLFKG